MKANAANAIEDSAKMLSQASPREMKNLGENLLNGISSLAGDMKPVSSKEEEPSDSPEASTSAPVNVTVMDLSSL